MLIFLHFINLLVKLWAGYLTLEVKCAYSYYPYLSDKHHLVHQVSLQSLTHSTTLRGVCQAHEPRAHQQAQDDTCFADTYFYSITGLLRQFLGWHWLSGLPSIMNLLVNFMLMCSGKRWMYDRVQSAYAKPGSVTCETQGRLGPLDLLFTGLMFERN